MPVASYLERLRINTARARLRRLQRTLPRYWRVGVIGGGTSHLGRMTRLKAVLAVNDMKLSIRYVDDEFAFIAAGDPYSGGVEK